MPSSPTARLRLERQNTGENFNTWGQRLNDFGLSLIDDAIAGFEEIAVNGAVVLTSANFAVDQARNAVLRTIGAGGFSVTIPAVEKTYLIDNACAAAVTITAGATGASVLPGERTHVYCDGVSVFKARMLDVGGQRLQNLGAPIAATDAATKAYVDSVANAPWQVKTSAYTAVNGDRIVADTSGAAWTLTLPASPPVGAEVTLLDARATWDTAPLTVARNGQTIVGLAENLICNQAAQRVSLVFAGGTWAVG
jgi:hypothetical protein